jgi:RNA polymerase sigma factor (sigma-70 family)
VLSRAALGDEAAWADLVEHLAPAVWKVARSVTLDPVVTSEAAQTTWLRLADRLDQRHDERDFESWFVATIEREALRALTLRGVAVPSS